MTAYLIYHGKESGEREDCSIFYTIPEVWLDKDAADRRYDELEAAVADDGYLHRVAVPIKG
jgi:hypothetical protein